MSQTSTGVPALDNSKSAAEDRELVRQCLEGSQQAWSTLIDKYKRLIYSVPLRYGFSSDDAADVFQGVCIELFQHLEELRHIEALRGWLMRVAVSKCFRTKRHQDRFTELNQPDQLSREDQPDWVEEVEREQLIREAIDSLQARCRDMIRMLFFDEPPKPYEEVARTLGLAVGSIGFIRGRCLKKLASALEERGQ